MSSRRVIILTTLLLGILAGIRPSLKHWLRRKLGALMHGLLRRRASPWPARPIGGSLFFAPHQDDSALGCGGLISLRREARETVHIAYITDGSASHPGHPEIRPDALAALRADEAHMATSIMGIPPACLHFLGAPDGRLPHLSSIERAALVEQMRDLVKTIAPSEVFITSRHDGSSEHLASFELARDALAGLSPAPRLIEYVVWARWNPLRLWRPLRTSKAIHHVSFPHLSERKQRAIQSYRSQVEPLPPWPHPLLSKEFLSLFSEPEEFFFEN